MGNDKLDQGIGAVKEGFGKATGDNETELKGKAQRLKGEAGEKLKDLKDGIAEKANDLIDKVEHND